MNKSGKSSERLGRYPFSGGISHYIAARSPYCTETTVREDARKLRYFARIFQELKEAGRVETTDPRHMSRGDIEAFLVWMRGRGLQVSARVKYLNVLEAYLASWGNNIIRELKADKTLHLPVTPSGGEIRALTPDELQRLLDCTYKMPAERGQIMRAVIALGFGTGCRPKEILGAEVRDVDIKRSRFFVRHPKGEGSWGIPQWIPIVRGDMLPFLEEYLEARKNASGSTGRSRDVPDYLFPSPVREGPISGNAVRVYKRELEDISGIPFQIKDLRSSLASITVAGDVSRIKAVSLQLRHSTVSTTEHYYARIDTSAEIVHSIGQVWQQHPIQKR